jgi:CrcB protein
MPRPLVSILVVAAGGSLGATLRYLTVLAGSRLFGTKFPIGTVTVNLMGCFLAGLLIGLLEQRLVLSPTVELLIFTGFLGGFTTLSAFSVETMNFIRVGNWGLAATNMVLNAVLGIVMVVVGMLAARAA